MPTVSQVISDVRQELNAVSLDGYIPAKFIHSKLLDAAKLFIKREADDRRLYLYPNVWVTIDDLELAETELIGCADIAVPYCTKIMKSTVRLPEIYTTRYGYLLNISSVDYTRNYIQTTPKQYNSIKNRKYQDPNLRYFWIYNNHLVIPEAMVKSVTLRAMFCDKAQGLRIEGCKDPGCIKTLEQEFTVPGHLLDNVKDYTVQKIAGVKLKIPKDEYPNLNEGRKQGDETK
jgi:hypothetical protein